MDIPTLEVRFEHVNVDTEAYVGSRALPTFLNFFFNMIEVTLVHNFTEFDTLLHVLKINCVLSCSQKALLNCLHLRASAKNHLSILHDVTGMIKPCRMTLLLGPPSSGKTTLLLALAGRLDRNLKFSGSITYNGHNINEFVPQRTVAYISQQDLHIPEMTVRETLSFSARCQGVGSRYDMLAELARREKTENIKPDPDIDIFMKAASTKGEEANVVTDYIIKVLGLENCADTMVGDDMIRGISGGQRKRVTTGELLVGPARVLLMDEISTGLDSSTTFQIVNSLKQFTHILKGTALISLLQPAPETYNLFDDIILLSDGQIVYQGPCEHVLEFFESMGFKCPERKGVADFLQEVTSRKDQKQYWAHMEESYSFVTVKEFTKAFQTFHVGNKLKDELSNPFDKSKSHPALLTTNKFLKQYIVLFFTNQMASGLFRLIAGLGRELIVSYTFGSFTLLILFSNCGFVLSRDEVKKWWIWGYWISPMMYGQSAVAVNEFLGKSWSHVLPSSSETMGVAVLKSRKFFTDAYWYWIGVVALIGFTLIFNLSYAAALTYLNPFVTHQHVKSESQSTDLDDESGETTQSSSQGSSKEADAKVTDQRKRGMVLPFEQFSITFDEITYSVNMPQMFIEEVMELVELSSLKGIIVGLPGVNGLSTEQRKRLTIAVELVANPSIIFMDEPTSGLDARSAAIVMRTVRNTVDTGRTVVCTIHQPSIDIFEAFDEVRNVSNDSLFRFSLRYIAILIYAMALQLLLLKRGGQEIYVGPLGHQSCHLIKYFQGIEGIRQIKDGYNPATWMLEVTTPGQEMVLGIDFADYYKDSELYRRNKALIKQYSSPAPGSKDLHFPTQYCQSFISQCMACLWKQHLSYWRNPQYTAVRVFFTTVTALMFGSMYWDLGSKRGKQQDIINAMGSMYTAVLFLGVQNAGAVQPVVAVERTVFYRERAAGMYSAFPYAFAQVAIEVPYIFQQALTYGVIVYSMIGFERNAIKFFWYIFFMYSTLFYFTLYGMMTAAVTPNYHIAGIVSSAFYAIWNLFTGFIVPQKRIPVWWRWYYWMCPVAWTLYGLIVSQFGDVDDMLDVGITVDEFLRSYLGYKLEFLGVVAAVMVAFPVVFALVFAISIKFFNFQNR
ncbi:hypothetical protein LWI29_009274 [Acer saccharum]|uniref:ABC transporter domain-containing protein n=1 Tax=Acer saccharum TaxID=4024 RepID=A0AA39SDB0_ACESA|nr:hypothetical protein LWI29_009274 [Acer saccharum]